jgi:hypothetical protein
MLDVDDIIERGVVNEDGASATIGLPGRTGDPYARVEGRWYMDLRERTDQDMAAMAANVTGVAAFVEHALETSNDLQAFKAELDPLLHEMIERARQSTLE